jgi:hypothetical protein
MFDVFILSDPSFLERMWKGRIAVNMIFDLRIYRPHISLVNKISEPEILSSGCVEWYLE